MPAVYVYGMSGRLYLQATKKVYVHFRLYNIAKGCGNAWLSVPVADIGNGKGGMVA